MPGYHDKKKKPKKMMGGGMMYKKGGKAKGSMKKKKLAAMYGDPKKITRGDIITAAQRKARSAGNVAKKVGTGLAKTMGAKVVRKLAKTMGQIKKRKK
jgi:hypothetical protein